MPETKYYMNQMLAKVPLIPEEEWEQDEIVDKVKIEMKASKSKNADHADSKEK